LNRIRQAATARIADNCKTLPILDIPDFFGTFDISAKASGTKNGHGLDNIRGRNGVLHVEGITVLFEDHVAGTLA
jgi:hypothetical protein